MEGMQAGEAGVGLEGFARATRSWMEGAGLVDCEHRLLTGGIACLFRGRVPA